MRHSQIETKPFDLSIYCSGIKQDKDGIWRTGVAQDVSYPESGHSDCLQVEDGSFWFQHRSACISTVLNLFPPKSSVFFDIGGGNGFVSLAVQKQGLTTVLLEPGSDGIRNARSRGVEHAICGTTETVDFHANSLPAVGLFDVVEHVEDDRAFLSKIYNLLEPGGKIYLTVPAYSVLWSPSDVHAGHYRRYSLRALSRLSDEIGFLNVYQTYFFKWLVFPIFFSRTLPGKIWRGVSSKKKVPSRDHLNNRSYISNLVNKVFARELKVINQRKRLLFGASCLMVLEKPERSVLDCKT